MVALLHVPGVDQCVPDLACQVKDLRHGPAFVLVNDELAFAAQLASWKSALMFGGVPTKTLVWIPRTSVSVISNIVPGTHTAAQASS